MDSVGRAHLARQWSLPAARRSLNHKTYVELSWRKPALAAAPVVVLHISDKSTFGKSHSSRSGDDEMVEHSHVDQSERLFEALREQFIRAARFRYTGRMVVREHHCGGVLRQRGLHHFARINAGLAQRPAKKLVRLDQ